MHKGACGRGLDIRPRYITATRRPDVVDHGEIMRDEEISEPEFLLQILQQIDDLRLDRHVERGDRLVADDELRLDRLLKTNPRPARREEHVGTGATSEL